VRGDTECRCFRGVGSVPIDDRSLLLVIRKAKEKGLVRRRNIKRTRETENSRGKNIKILRKNSS
jgi:hypothetical protein